MYVYSRQQQQVCTTENDLLGEFGQQPCTIKLCIRGENRGHTAHTHPTLHCLQTAQAILTPSASPSKKRVRVELTNKSRKQARASATCTQLKQAQTLARRMIATTISSILRRCFGDSSTLRDRHARHREPREGIDSSKRILKARKTNTGMRDRRKC